MKFYCGIFDYACACSGIYVKEFKKFMVVHSFLTKMQIVFDVKISGLVNDNPYCLIRVEHPVF